MIEFLGVLLLFLFGVRLSAFFSGIETAFYRSSKLRLNIDAQTGDALSQKILSYVRDPSTFVATILIGNNLANYVTTYAIGFGAILILGELTEVAEVSVTICISPVIFIFGELLPKTLHYRAPLIMLRRYFIYFRLVHWLLLPLSWPLMLLTSLLQKLGGTSQQPILKILGRRPLANVIGRGHDEGVLTSIQHDLMQGVFQNANLPLGAIITPKEVAISFEQTPSRAKLLECAQSFGLVEIIVSEENDSFPSLSYYRVAELLLSKAPLNHLKKILPVIAKDSSRLEALLMLQEQDADVGAIYENNQLIGVVRHRTLAELILQGGNLIGSTPSV